MYLKESPRRGDADQLIAPVADAIAICLVYWCAMDSVGFSLMRYEAIDRINTVPLGYVELHRIFVPHRHVNRLPLLADDESVLGCECLQFIDVFGDRHCGWIHTNLVLR